MKYKFVLATQNTSNDCRSVSFHNAWQQSTPHVARLSFIELRVMCAVTAEWDGGSPRPYCSVPVTKH